MTAERGGSRDTIFALATAPGRSAIAVVRVSGPATAAAVVQLAGSRDPVPRRATLRTLKDACGRNIDDALVLWFPAPASATGEDVAEFHLHGGRAVAQAVLDVLLAMPGLRPAEPGEFTRRAVEAGKLDLTQAEGLADLIDAQTEAQRLQALRQYDGALAELYEGWRARLVSLSAWAEAGIDFADEELPDGLGLRLRTGVDELLRELQAHLADERCGEIVRDGLFLTVIGPPNAGKSSFVNALAKRDVAIVAETPGTTRDVLEVRLDLAGYEVILSDTAGLRRAREAVEAEGVRRALARAEASDMTVLLLDGAAADPCADLAEVPPATLTVWNKSDLPWPVARDGLKISCRTGEGFDDLISVLAARVRDRLERAHETPAITRARHRHALQTATEALQRALGCTAEHPELMAEDLRLALRAVGRITGRVDIEELLDTIFRDFCIGK